MSGVDVAVEVGLDHGVHGDHAQAADQLRVVADFLRAQHDAPAVKIEVLMELSRRFRAQGQGCGRGKVQLARAQHGQQAVLQHLGVSAHVLEGSLVEPRHHGIGHVPYTRLQGQQLGGHAP